MTAAAPTAPRLARLERRYGAVLFLTWFATVLPGAVAVLYAQSRGLSLAEVGLYTAVYSAGVALLDLPTGHLADTVGRRAVALWGTALSAAAALVLLLATSLPAFVLYAFVLALARALKSGALDAWYVDALRELDPGADLQPRLARMQVVELSALAAGALAGAALPGLARAAWPALPPLAAPVLAAAVGHLLTVGAIWHLIREPSVRAGPRPMRLGGALRGAGTLLREDATLRRLLALQGLSGLGVAALETYWQPFFTTVFGGLGGQTGALGVLLAGAFAAAALGHVAARPLLRRLDGQPARLGAWTQAGGALALLALAWAGPHLGLWPCAAVFWLVYLSRSAGASPLLAAYHARVPGVQRALMLSVLSVAFFAGASAGNALLGAVSNAASVPWAWTVAALLLLLGVVLYWRWPTEDEDKA